MVSGFDSETGRFPTKTRFRTGRNLVPLFTTRLLRFSKGGGGSKSRNLVKRQNQVQDLWPATLVALQPGLLRFPATQRKDRIWLACEPLLVAGAHALPKFRSG